MAGRALDWKMNDAFGVEVGTNGKRDAEESIFDFVLQQLAIAGERTLVGN